MQCRHCFSCLAKRFDNLPASVSSLCALEIHTLGEQFPPTTSRSLSLVADEPRPSDPQRYTAARGSTADHPSPCLTGKPANISPLPTSGSCPFAPPLASTAPVPDANFHTGPLHPDPTSPAISSASSTASPRRMPARQPEPPSWSGYLVSNARAPPNPRPRPWQFTPAFANATDGETGRNPGRLAVKNTRLLEATWGSI